MNHTILTFQTFFFKDPQNKDMPRCASMCSVGFFPKMTLQVLFLFGYLETRGILLLVQEHTDAHERYNISTPLLHKGKLKIIFIIENVLRSEGTAMHGD